MRTAQIETNLQPFCYENCSTQVRLDKYQGGNTVLLLPLYDSETGNQLGQRARPNGMMNRK